jgi:hypothetical protein
MYKVSREKSGEKRFLSKRYVIALLPEKPESHNIER